MLVRRWGRSLALGFVFACSLPPAARAGGHLFGGCHSDGCETAVQLPAQHVVVQAPRVTVQENWQVIRGGVGPAWGAVYMPAAVPLMGFGVAAGPPAAAAEDNPLRGAHAAALAHLQYTKAYGAAQLEADATKRALAAAAPPAEAIPAPKAAAAPADVTAEIDKINKKLDDLASRLTAVERLVLIHDNYLQEQIKNAARMPPANGVGGPR